MVVVTEASAAPLRCRHWAEQISSPRCHGIDPDDRAEDQGLRGLSGRCQDERDQLGLVVQELNQILTALVPDAGLVLEMVRWETHVHPGLGTDAQDVVTQQLQIGEYDIFVGIFWLRFGTPTPRAESGTEEEFQIAHRAWTARGRAIQIMMYFCRALAPPPDDSGAVEQLQKVVTFRKKLLDEGLVRDYGDHAEFAGNVRRDLVLVLGQMLHATSSQASIAAQAAELTTEDDRELTWEKLRALADEYELIRDPTTGMRSGPERTRRMEIVASKMRGMALSAYPFLSELTSSKSAGERLAAVSILEAIPDVRYVEWLAGRLAPEKPFVGYHAALGLLSAARSLDIEDLPRVRAGLEAARQGTRAALNHGRSPTGRLHPAAWPARGGRHTGAALITASDRLPAAISLPGPSTQRFAPSRVSQTMLCQ